jgi:hypothetical protein
MSSLLTLPDELRLQIYKHYLEGLELRVQPRVTDRWLSLGGPRAERYLVFVRKDRHPHARGLLFVNRLIYHELLPLLPSHTPLVFAWLTHRYKHDCAKPVEAMLPPAFLQGIEHVIYNCSSGGHCWFRYLGDGNEQFLARVPRLKRVTLHETVLERPVVLDMLRRGWVEYWVWKQHPLLRHDEELMELLDEMDDCSDPGGAGHIHPTLFEELARTEYV